MKNILIVIALTLPNAGCTQTPASINNAQKIDQFIDQAITEQKLAGASIEIIQDGKTIFQRNYGYADREHKVPVSSRTTFQLMSITKMFVAASIMQLVNEKKIELNDPVTKYITGLPKIYQQVSILHLLNHTGGVPDYVEIPGYMAGADRQQKPLEILSGVLLRPLEFIPGDKWNYSNSGYFLLGLVIEQVSGKSLQNYLKEKIFEPLDMEGSYLDHTGYHDTLKAIGYTFKNNALTKERVLNPSQYWAAGGIISDVDDMTRWNNSIDNGTITSKEILQTMMQPGKLSNGHAIDYGIGFELMNTPELHLVGHTGTGLGFNTAFFKLPGKNITVIVLTNTTHASFIAPFIAGLFVAKDTVSTPGLESIRTNDKLDSFVRKVFTDAAANTVNENYFQSTEGQKKFKLEDIPFIQQKGKLFTMTMKGEKLNPESIVRRYEIGFEKGITSWVIIFSKDGRIIIANHM